MEPGLSTVDVLLEELTSGIHGVLRDALVGVYVYGSYVSGSFDSDVGDLDLAVVTSMEAGAIDLAGLGRVHHDFVDRTRNGVIESRSSMSDEPRCARSGPVSAASR